MTNKTERILAFDYGSKRIGIACGNTLLRLAEPLKTIQSKNKSPNWNEILDVIREWRPSTLVVGLPLSMAGDETEMSGAAREFGKQLAERAQIDVVYFDERLTSSEADQIIKSITPDRKKIKKKHISMRDNLAAQLILQSYFDDN